MAYTPDLTKFAQSVYLTIKGRYLDDIEDTDGQDFIAQTVDFLSGFIDELENMTDATGQMVYWNFSRSLNFDLGDAAVGQSTVALPSEVRVVVANYKRPIRLIKDGVVISKWAVVSPNQLGEDGFASNVCSIGGSLYFSRSFNDNEDGATITGDVLQKITRPSESEDSVLDIITPRQLLVLGVAKNMVLPDIVQGGLTPSFVQKYNDLLQSVIANNSITSESDYQDREDYSFITGVGF